jgi:hypothetical protein
MNLGYILLIIFAGFWVLSLFFGYIGGLSKTFSNTPSAMDSSAIKTQEQKTIDDTKDKEKQMMDDMKQKIQDGYKKL